MMDRFEDYRDELPATETESDIEEIRRWGLTADRVIEMLEARIVDGTQVKIIRDAGLCEVTLEPLLDGPAVTWALGNRCMICVGECGEGMNHAKSPSGLSLRRKRKPTSGLMIYVRRCRRHSPPSLTIVPAIASVTMDQAAATS